jgi:hypothetical protein
LWLGAIDMNTGLETTLAPNPMLRRSAPCMGLTMWHLSEVLT